MRVEVQDVALREAEADVLAVPLVEDRGLTPVGNELDGALDGLLARLAQERELRGELGFVRLVHVDGRLPSSRIAVAGIGNADRIDADALRTVAAAVAAEAGDFAESVAWASDETLPLPADEQARALVEGTLLGGYDPARWKHDEPKPKLDRLTLCADEGVKETVERTTLVSNWVNRARDLVNSPPNEATPERLAARAAEIAAALEHVETEALDREQIRAAGMGAFGAVAQGSHNEPRLVVLRYEPPQPARADLVLGLVGKAITFDTGGVSLKPSLHMQDMKGDMAGGAPCIEGTGAVADLRLPIRVIAV